MAVEHVQSVEKTITQVEKTITQVEKTITQVEKTITQVERNKMHDVIRKAIKSVTEYNSQLNQERKEERKAFMDLQTYTIHFPVGLGRENKGLKHARKKLPGKYPVALIQGQYQDWYMKYAPQELKYFPLNTVLYGPLNDPSKLPPLLQSDGSQSDSDEDSNLSDDSSCSSDRGTHDDEDNRNDDDSSDSDTNPPPLLRQNKIKPNAICKVCNGNYEKNKMNQIEDLVHCSECDNSAHPSCLEFNQEMKTAVESYSWQCMDCKTCVHCGKPHDEDKMMFCDKCDRGYHTFCVGLKNIPHGRWVCTMCTNCDTNSRIQGPSNRKSKSPFL